MTINPNANAVEKEQAEMRAVIQEQLTEIADLQSENEKLKRELDERKTKETEVPDFLIAKHIALNKDALSEDLKEADEQINELKRARPRLSARAFPHLESFCSFPPCKLRASLPCRVRGLVFLRRSARSRAAQVEQFRVPRRGSAHALGLARRNMRLGVRHKWRRVRLWLQALEEKRKEKERLAAAGDGDAARGRLRPPYPLSVSLFPLLRPRPGSKTSLPHASVHFQVSPFNVCWPRSLREKVHAARLIPRLPCS
eukprot:2903375-Pleurochrysis_carterae.AAC.1